MKSSWRRAAASSLAVVGLACSHDAQAPELTELHLDTISVGAGHTCGLTATGAGWCWGNNTDGKLGTGPALAGDQIVPAAVAGGLRFSSISAGEFHSCAVAVDGVAYCWGQNSRGALGTGDPTGASRALPTPVAAEVRFNTIAAGAEASCAIATTGDAYCWGDNNSGVLGVGDGNDRTVPTLVLGGLKFVSISLTGGGVPAGTSACALTAAGKAYCWGSNSSGQLGTALLGGSTVPVAAAAELTFASLSTGGGYACGITTAQDAYCWGRQLFGAVDIELVSGGHKWASIVLSESAQCGITVGAQGFCWGNNDYGKLGNGLSASLFYTEPTAIVGGLSFSTLAPGRSHSCGLTVDHVAYCWGLGLSGLLGIGTIPDSPIPYVSYTPTPVSAPES